MATILDLKTQIASNLSGPSANLTVADFTVNGIDMALWALNESRRYAELNNDFEFQRQILTLDIDPVTGGSLGDAVIQGTATTTQIKSIVEMGIFDVNLNFRPVQWTSTAESIERQRQENPYDFLRFPTDAQAECWPAGQRRLIVRNNQVFNWPHTALSQNNQVISIGIEAFVFSGDWTAASDTIVLSGGSPTGINTTYYPYGTYNGYKLYLNLAPAGALPANAYAVWNREGTWIITVLADLGAVSITNRYSNAITSQDPSGTYGGSGSFTGILTIALTNTDTTSDIWTTLGSEYLLWASVVRLNQRFKYFVPRTEGNLPPPQDLAAAALQAFIDYDIYRVEQFRRHGR